MLARQMQFSAVLTHHWLVRRRGGEKVLEALAELLGPTPLYTLVHDQKGYPWPPHELAKSWTGDADAGPQSSGERPRVSTSWLQRLPGAVSNYAKLLPLMPAAARAVRLPDVDLVLCSDAALAKGFRPDPRSRVICYCHSPMRYAWEPAISREYAATLPALLQPLWPLVCARVRQADRMAARNVHQFIANSATVAERIMRCYGRESVVIHPPVDLPDSPTLTDRRDYFLCVGYHVAYKRLEHAVVACERLGQQLVVIGDGPDVTRLRGRASSRIRFLGFQPDSVVHEHYRAARALLFPGEEDFGIVPVEAIARGCPVVALGRGGARETVVPSLSGVLYEDATIDGLVAAIGRLTGFSFDPCRMHEFAQKFSRRRFHEQIAWQIEQVLAEKGLQDGA